MNNLISERGFVFPLVMSLLTVLFLFAALLAILAHNVLWFLAMVLLGVTVYPVVTQVKRRFLT